MQIKKSNGIQLVDNFLEEMIQQKQIPGVVYAVVNQKQTIAENAIGLSHITEHIPMTLNKSFDLASLTKVCATLPSVFLLIGKGLIDIDDPVNRYFPETNSSKLKLRHLLTHTSGFVASFPFYKYKMTKEQVQSFILSQNCEPDRKVTYSDLNFILLGMLIERVIGKPLDQFAIENIYRPLGMTKTTFNPSQELSSIAPTEWLASEGKFQWGEVHDENANYFGGVSGHAGLFSNLHDLKIYVQMLLNNGKTSANSYLIPSGILQASHRNYTATMNEDRGLGWALAESPGSSAGFVLSPKSYGHTGFTGTSFWIDPERDMGFILLTNRVHINRQIDMTRIRKIFHTLVISEIQ